MAGFADHFSKTATSYSQYRPGYPTELFEYLASLCPEHGMMWDCATGSGQAAHHFTKYFDNVIASDASYEQICNAQKQDGLLYLTSLAEQAPFADHKLDLITVAQALHWFELERFYSEVKRILKPAGVFAVWTYNLMQINPAVDAVVWQLYNDILGDYWPFERKLVENGYRDLYFPFSEQVVPDFAMQLEWNLEHLFGYLSTWSAVKRYKEANQINPVAELASQLESAWGKQERQTVSWPLSIKVTSL